MIRFFIINYTVLFLIFLIIEFDLIRKFINFLLYITKNLIEASYFFLFVVVDYVLGCENKALKKKRSHLFLLT